MNLVTYVRLTVSKEDLKRFLDEDAQPAIQSVLSSYRGSLRDLTLHPPGTVDLVLQFPSEMSQEHDAVISAVCQTLGHRLGLRDELRWGPLPVARSAAAPAPKFRGIGGRGKRCERCGGVDGSHNDWCPLLRS